MDKFSAVENSYSNSLGMEGRLPLLQQKKQGQDLFTWNARRNTEIDTKKRRLLCIDSRFSLCKNGIQGKFLRNF